MIVLSIVVVYTILFLYNCREWAILWQKNDN